MTFGFDLTVNLALIIGLVGSALGLLVRQFRAVNARVDHVEDKAEKACEKAMAMCNDHGKRLDLLDAIVPALPKADDLHRLQLAITEMRGDHRELRAVMTGNAQMMGRLEMIVQRQEEHLLSKS